MKQLENFLIENREDLTEQEKQQTKEIFKLFRKLTEELIFHDTVIVLNALDLCKEFFMEELGREKSGGE